MVTLCVNMASQWTQILGQTSVYHFEGIFSGEININMKIYRHWGKQITLQ